MVLFWPLMEFLFFVVEFLLPGDAPADHFCYATQNLLTLNNQKNAIRSETVSHLQSESAAACQVKAGNDIFLRLRGQGCDPTTPIGDFTSDHGFCSISASNIIAIIRTKTQRVGAARLGFPLEDVGTHSICSGGAMAMHISNASDQTLMAIERWRSLGFMVYIQQQILSFSTGVSFKMSQQPYFGISDQPAIHQAKHTQTLTHHPILDPFNGLNNTPLLTTPPSLHLIARARFYPSFQPKLLKNHRAGAQSKISTKTWST